MVEPDHIARVEVVADDDVIEAVRIRTGERGADAVSGS
jgi:hypothetical protein